MSGILLRSALILALFLAPAIGEQHTSLILGSAAYAKGGEGGGNSGGNGGGHGGGNNGGHGNGHSADADGSHSPGHGKENGRNQGNGYGELGNNHGSVASKLGSLNAAHASQNARQHASASSMVGQIAAYEQAVEDARSLETSEERAIAEEQAVGMLADISNKDVDQEVVNAVNELLGIGPAAEPEPEN